MKTRKATPEELDQIYMMGFDVWADGNSKSDYLNACRTSPKYLKGSWFVLTNESQLLSSLIVYDFGNNIFGIGSISTPLPSRQKGYASELISNVILEIEQKHPAAILFLYSDIQPEFYEKFNFIKLPLKLQRYTTTTCMVRGKNINHYFSDEINSPEYF